MRLPYKIYEKKAHLVPNIRVQDPVHTTWRRASVRATLAVNFSAALASLAANFSAALASLATNLKRSKQKERYTKEEKRTNQRSKKMQWRDVGIYYPYTWLQSYNCSCNICVINNNVIWRLGGIFSRPEMSDISKTTIRFNGETEPVNKDIPIICRKASSDKSIDESYIYSRVFLYFFL